MANRIRITILLALSGALAAACGISSSSSPSNDSGPEPAADAASEATGPFEASPGDGDGTTEATSDATGGSEAGPAEGGGTTDGGLAASCTASGGTVSTSTCCGSVSDFPNNCSIGACSCAPSSSHTVMVCTCPSGQCFDGTSCH